jgi:predicted ATP-grasp superfamily ATP-dependent carboligase
MSEPEHANVLLLDGSSMACLAFARSLGRAGVQVTAADHSPRAPVRHSKYCERFLTYPSPLESPEEFRAWLRRELRREHYAALIGCTDFTLPLLDEMREELEPLTRAALPGREGFRLAYDKEATLRLAAALRLAVPRTFYLSSEADLEAAAREARFPVVLKARSSVLTAAGSEPAAAAGASRRTTAGVEYAFGAEELKLRARKMHECSGWPLAQEYVAGAGVGTFFLLHGGEVLARFQHRRIRDKNPTGSGSCLRVSVEPDAALMESSEKLLRAMKWEGLAMVEFKVAPDGKAYLMEVNPRPWGSMQLAVEAGVDFPLLWYRLWTGGQVTKVEEYRAGIECRYLAGDFKHLESVLLGPPPGWKLEYPRRLPTLLRFLRLWGANLRYDDFAGDDFGPGLAEISAYFGGLLRRALGRRRQSLKE